MNVLVVDMTHGGLLIASELSKIYEKEILAWDIYGTVDESTKRDYNKKGLKFINKISTLSDDDLMVIAPVHCNFESKVDMSHHDAVKYILKDRINVPIIEVTGVKGKTSVVGMLKEIFKEVKPLVLSSLGVEVFDGRSWKLLKRNISITPASIIEAWGLVKDYEVGICIFETSLGGTGLADIGILTNLAEDYPIANGSSSASMAKGQIFKSKLVACDLDSFNSKYSEFKEKTNIFYNKIVNDKVEANLTVDNIEFGFDKTEIRLKMVDFKTIHNNTFNGSLELSTFAPASIHINNVMAAVSAALMFEMPIKNIQAGMANFKGLKGRTSINCFEGIRIIEEINPGLNVAAVKESLYMMDDMDDVAIVFGGKYGVTCEEIDENSVSKVLDSIEDNNSLILVDELGSGVKNSLNRDFNYYDNIDDGINFAIKNDCSNILVIYRSNYSDLKNR